MSDLYYVPTGRENAFKARPVVGGHLALVSAFVLPMIATLTLAQSLFFLLLPLEGFWDAKCHSDVPHWHPHEEILGIYHCLFLGIPGELLSADCPSY